MTKLFCDACGKECLKGLQSQHVFDVPGARQSVWDVSIKVTRPVHDGKVVTMDICWKCIVEALKATFKQVEES